jgi:O-antigen ligase
MTERAQRRRDGTAEWALAAAPLAVATLGPLLPLLIIFAGTLPASAPHVDPHFVMAIAALVVLAMVVTLVGLTVVGVRHFPAPLWLPLGALVASQLLALAFAVNPVAGMFGVATTVGGVIVLVAANEVLSRTQLRRAFLACYFVSGTAAALVALVLSIMRLPPAMFAYEHGRASGTFLQPNEFAGYLLFLIPLGLAQLGAPRWLLVTGLAGAASGIAGLIASVSRAALASMALALPILVRRFGRVTMWAYAVAAVIGLVAMVTVLRDVAHDPSENASRIAVWGGSLRMAQRFALTGVGPFGFHLAYPAFRRPEVNVDELHAHDLPLHILIEDGILGFAALAWFVIAAVRQAARAGAAIPTGDRERVLLFCALSVGFAASALQNLVDVVTTFLLIVAWPMLGLMLALGRDESAAT